jgi:hypothetical protein
MIRLARTALAAWLLAAAGCGAQGPAPKPPSGAKKTMIQLTLLKGDDEIAVAAPRKALTPAPPPALSNAAPEGAGYTRPFANESQNSRLPYALGNSAWGSAWKLPLDPEMPPSFVLAHGDRYVVHSRQWRIVDRDGKTIATDRLGGGPILIDPALRTAITHYTSAYLSFRRLADGGEIFQYLPGQGDVFSRAFLTRQSSRLLILGWERALDPHGHKKPESSRIEILDLGMPPRADDFGFLVSGTPIGELYIGWVGVQAASAGPRIVAAAANELYEIDWDLNVKAVYEGSFEPHGLSLDEAGNTYMAGLAGGASRVWKISPRGEILFDFALPGGAQPLPTPPIVGYDHTVYQIAGSMIYALAPNGRLRWSRAAEGPLGGASVTADGFLLTAEGSCVVSYDGEGERKKVVCLDGEKLTAPPVLTEDGRLLAASAAHLHCLTRR